LKQIALLYALKGGHNETKHMTHRQELKVRKLINIVRYMDDIGIASFLDFENTVKDIYPRSLVLNKSNSSATLNSAFLGLSVSVIDHQFQIKVYQ
jgi:hypothetical protein